MFEGFEKKVETVGIATAEKLNFTKLTDHIGETIQIYGFFISTKGKYGDQVSVVTSPESAVTLPKRYVDIFRALTVEEIIAITRGKVKLANIRPVSTKMGNSTEFDIVCEGE